MGQAKIRKLNREPTVYHHTSTLRTNEIWMSGQILPEGKMNDVLHPVLGVMQSDARFRRPMIDFPPLVWLTTQIEVPRCLKMFSVHFVNEGGVVSEIQVNDDVANSIALNRFALGFPIKAIGAVPWKDHRGYSTEEGKKLNETAIDAGDDPENWYVTEAPVDVLHASEVWFSRSKLRPKLTREDWYFEQMRKMVTMCRDNPGTFIPPSWLTQEQGRALARRMGVPVANL